MDVAHDSQLIEPCRVDFAGKHFGFFIRKDFPPSSLSENVYLLSANDNLEISVTLILLQVEMSEKFFNKIFEKTPSFADCHLRDG